MTQDLQRLLTQTIWLSGEHSAAVDPGSVYFIYRNPEPFPRPKRLIDVTFGDRTMMITIMWRSALFVLLTTGTTTLMALPYLD